MPSWLRPRPLQPSGITFWLLQLLRGLQLHDAALIDTEDTALDLDSLREINQDDEEDQRARISLASQMQGQALAQMLLGDSSGAYDEARKASVTTPKNLKPFFTERLLSWADSASSSPDALDPKVWPLLQDKAKASSSWDSGLYRPHVYVISMENSKARRPVFAEAFKKLGMSIEGAFWLPAVDGFKAPREIINPNGKDAVFAEKAFNNRPGVFGCYMSHLIALRRHMRRCPECDLIVFEDDVQFHPEFKQKMQEFTTGLPKQLPSSDSPKAPEVPVARYHLGGDAFWTPFVRETPTYYQISSVSRTWGYVVKGNEFGALIQQLREANSEQNMGIDQQLSGKEFIQKFAVLTPRQPLVISPPGGTSTTASLHENNGAETIVKANPVIWEKGKDCWFATYLPGMPCLE